MVDCYTCCSPITLLQACANDDVNALHFAAQKGHKEICRLLINKGIVPTPFT